MRKESACGLLPAGVDPGGSDHDRRRRAQDARQPVTVHSLVLAPTGPTARSPPVANPAEASLGGGLRLELAPVTETEQC